MTYGIIYRAYNKISKKSYVGQTTRPLETRIRRHLFDAKRYDFKFSNALKCYPSESWVWEILAEVEVEKLDEYEKFFMNDLDTISNGYNCCYPRNSRSEYKTRRTKVYSVYHPDFGVVSGTTNELTRINSNLCKVSELLIKRLHICGWVLSENKERYVNIVDPFSLPITLVHKEFGEHTLLREEFVEKFGLTRNGICKLTTSLYRSHRGWRLLDDSKTKN